MRTNPAMGRRVRARGSERAEDRGSAVASGTAGCVIPIGCGSRAEAAQEFAAFRLEFVEQQIPANANLPIGGGGGRKSIKDANREIGVPGGAPIPLISFERISTFE